MITIDKIDREEALRYLSCKSQSNLDSIEPYLDKCEELVLDALKPRYVYRKFSLEFIEKKPILKECGLALEGNDIAELLNDCESVIMMAVTTGSNIDALIRRLQVEDMALAVIADAFSGAAAEQTTNAADSEIRAMYPNMNFTDRFSPGYGDLPITLQKNILTLLDAQKRIGLALGSGGLLTPIKSVTAFMGMSEKEVSRKKRGCSSCNMRDNCQYRKDGTSCGF